MPEIETRVGRVVVGLSVVDHIGGATAQVVLHRSDSTAQCPHAYLRWNGHLEHAEDLGLSLDDLRPHHLEIMDVLRLDRCLIRAMLAEEVARRDQPPARTIPARYPASCRACGQPIRTGDPIAQHWDTGQWVHEACASNAAAGVNSKIHRLEAALRLADVLDPDGVYGSPEAQAALAAASETREAARLAAEVRRRAEVEAAAARQAQEAAKAARQRAEQMAEVAANSATLGGVSIVRAEWLSPEDWRGRLDDGRQVRGYCDCGTNWKVYAIEERDDLNEIAGPEAERLAEQARRILDS
jgi:hypothetical protein